MFLIAHRGNYNGVDLEAENNPTKIDHVLDLEYDCEIDLQVKNGELYLGHDNPQYKINAKFLERDHLWVHLKSMECLNYMNDKIHYFWHQTDLMTITSKGFIWQWPGNEFRTNKSIHLFPNVINPFIAGICSDDVEKIFNVDLKLTPPQIFELLSKMSLETKKDINWSKKYNYLKSLNDWYKEFKYE